MKVKPISAIKEMKYDCVVVTTYLQRETIYDELVRNGVDKKDIKVYF